MTELFLNWRLNKLILTAPIELKAWKLSDLKKRNEQEEHKVRRMGSGWLQSAALIYLYRTTMSFSQSSPNCQLWFGCCLSPKRFMCWRLGAQCGGTGMWWDLQETWPGEGPLVTGISPLEKNTDFPEWILPEASSYESVNLIPELLWLSVPDALPSCPIQTSAMMWCHTQSGNHQKQNSTASFYF